MPLSPLLARYERVLLDLDGCVWVGDEPTPRAVEAVSALREAGRRVAFVTNDGRHAGEDFVRKLWRLGFQASLEEVVTVGGALQHWLAERTDRARTAFVIGSPAIWRHVEDAGMRIVNDTDLAGRADLVVVAGHERFDYAELRDAVQAGLRGAGIVAAGRDPTFPMPDGPWPGTGAIVAAVEAATGVQALSVGKPSAELFHTALARLAGESPPTVSIPSAGRSEDAAARGVAVDEAAPRTPEDDAPVSLAARRERAAGAGRAGPARDGSALVVGDRLDADLAGAAAAGLDAAIVLTGATGRAAAEAAKDPAPVAVAETLGELVLGRA